MCFLQFAVPRRCSAGSLGGIMKISADHSRATTTPTKISLEFPRPLHGYPMLPTRDQKGLSVFITCKYGVGGLSQFGTSHFRALTTHIFGYSEVLANFLRLLARFQHHPSPSTFLPKSPLQEGIISQDGPRQPAVPLQRHQPGHRDPAGCAMPPR
jgi:hypothetical protein